MRCGTPPAYAQVCAAQEELGWWLRDRSYWTLLPEGLFKNIKKLILLESGVPFKQLDRPLLVETMSRSTNEQDPMPEGALEEMSIDFLEDGPDYD